MVFKFFLNCIWRERASVNPAGFSEWGLQNLAFSETECYCTEIFSLPMEINIEAFLTRVYPLQLDLLFSFGKKGVTEPMHSPLEEDEKGLSWPATPSLGGLGGPGQQTREGFRQEESAPRWVQVFSPTVFQEVFVKLTEAAWGDSALGSPPAQLQPVLQFYLQPGNIQSQLHGDRRGGCSALCCVTIYDGYFTASVHCLAPAAGTRPATAGMQAVSLQAVSV